MSEPLTSTPIGWAVSTGLTPYAEAVAFMEARAAAIAAGDAAELVWLLEHPPLYTAGTSAKPGDLLAPDRFPVFKSSRGGQFTYHGPGQRVAYVMLDVKRRANGDIRAFVGLLGTWLSAALAHFDINAGMRPDRIGLWVEQKNAPGMPAREEKIAALGIRVRRWVSFHGIALNVAPDLSHFSGIVPCGIQDHGVTSLRNLGVASTMAEVDEALRTAFEHTFGPIKAVAAPLF